LITDFINLTTSCAFIARKIKESDSLGADASSKLWLCGSRGVGGIACVSDGITSLELLDIEEEEEEEFEGGN